MLRVVCAIVLLAAATASANSNWRKVEESRIPVLKKALVEALYAKQFSCNGTVTENGKTTNAALNFASVTYNVEAAREVWMSADQRQPIMYTMTDELNYRTMLHFTTTPDRRTILKVDLTQVQYERQNRNVGTIDEPVYQETEVILQDVRGSCE